VRKAIVTGANGFVGYWLVSELVKHDVTVLAVVKDENENISMFDGMSRVQVIYCELSNIAKLSKEVQIDVYDVFYHLAWISAGGSGRANYDIQLSNAKFTCDAAIVAKELGCKKFLAAGTITEKIASEILVSPVKAENLIYGICKHTTHCLLDIICQKINLPYIWMQFSNLYGPYSINGNIVGNAIDKLSKDENATFGSAMQPYDLLYIEDLVCAAYLLGIKETKSTCYYIGSGSPCLLKEYLIRLGEACKKPGLIKIGARADDGLKFDLKWFDTRSLQSDTGFSVQFTFEEGLQKTIAWMEEMRQCR
jgi:nucleoside-diphosphate-sugar epimerase